MLGGAWAALDTAFKHLSNLDLIAATLATMGLGSLDLISALSGGLVILAALLRAALPFSASTSAAYAINLHRLLKTEYRNNGENLSNADSYHATTYL